MMTPLKVVAAALSLMPLLSIAIPAMAETAERPGMDALCDYCRDYSDLGVLAGSVRSDYRPGTGYAAEPEQTAAAMQRLNEDQSRRAGAGRAELKATD